MTKDYLKFLAFHVISESKIISYRMLSRELKVHCSAAKRMLYEFYTNETKKKPGSVHATYLLYGTQSAETYYAVTEPQRDGEDISMASSPYMSSSMPQDEDEQEAPSVKVMTLVREEDLEAVKAKYEDVLSIHIYSLSPSPINNMQILSDCNRQVLTKFRHEDPLKFNAKYGTIQNPKVKRRTGVCPPPPPPVVEPPKSKPTQAEPAKGDVKTVKAPEKSSLSTNIAPKPETKPATQPKTAEKKPTLKKETSDIFKSFGKTKAPAAKVTSEENDTSNASATAQIKEDEPMKDTSESEQGEDDFMPSTTASKPRKTSGLSKSEREATLRKMMDEDSDEEMSDAASKEPTPPSPALDEPPPAKAPTPEPPVQVSGGRRRGRRKVMRKTTVEDEEGYIITREEPAWESFSEDEPPPPAAKRVQLPTPATSTAKGPKKGGPKAGQGNIMQFFGKPKK